MERMGRVPFCFSCDEQQQLLRRARWGWRNLDESRTVTDGWSLEESGLHRYRHTYSYTLTLTHTHTNTHTHTRTHICPHAAVPLSSVTLYLPPPAR
jgi:hypothetical protein